MSAAVKRQDTQSGLNTSEVDPQHREVYAYAGEAFQLIDQHKTPPYPSTFALWYAYVSKANESLVTSVDDMIKRGSVPSPYEINEMCKAHLSDRKAEEAQQEISRDFQHELAGVLDLIQESVDSSDKFQAALGKIEEGLPEAGAPDRVQLLLSRLMAENQRMVSQTQELNKGLRESQKQIEKLNDELEDVRNLSMRDALTGIANRRAFDARIDAELAQAEASGSALCLALADIDRFKRVNDTFGHRIGDEVLRIFASVIGENIKGQDHAARYGGEEFAIILPKTQISAAFHLIDKIRVEFFSKELVLRNSGKTLGKISASFGISMFEPGMTARDMIEHADKKLYEAKNCGRNQVRAEGVN
ncbi:MAG: GGDEF domain-containing protein [Hyphomonadaceae bacterium]|nr:GGDEF domain-containing protein [Hyphomonadaceae bacterium]